MKTSIAQQPSWVKYCCALMIVLLSATQVRAQEVWAQVRAEHIAKLQGMMGTYEGELNGKYPIRLVLRPGDTDSSVVGTYYYLSKGKPLELRGYIQPNLSTPSVELRELAPTDTVPTGWFSIGLGYEPEVLGHWYNKSGTTLLPLRMRRINGAAQPAVSSARVTAKTYLKRYTVPVATVPNAAVTTMLAHWFSLESLTGQDLASLRQDLKVQEEEHLHGGLQDLTSEVGYNAYGLLSITATQEGVGANVWYMYHTQTIDLATGFPVNVLDELQPELLPQFFALGQRKLNARVREYLKEQEYGSKESLLTEDDAKGLRGQRFDENSLQEFTVKPGSLEFDHPARYDGLSNFIFKLLQGSFQVKFTTAELKPFLKPNSPLQRLP
jgi:hypothetical protein